MRRQANSYAIELPWGSLVDLMCGSVGILALLGLVLSLVLVMTVGYIKLKIVSENLPPCVAGRVYDVTLAARGGDPPLRWSAIVVSDPTGFITNYLKFNPSKGHLFGEVPASKVTNPTRIVLRISVQNKLGSRFGPDTDTKDFEIHLLPYRATPNDVPPPEILTDKLPDAVQGRHYEVRLAVRGGIPPYRWSLLSPWPFALVFEEGNGRIVGTPNAPCSKQDFIVKVTDGFGRESPPKRLSLAVIAMGKQLPSKYQMPRIVTDSLPNAVTGRSYKVRLSVIGGYPPFRWTCEGKLPSGLTLSDHAGDKGALITGEPAKGSEGEYKVVFSVRDSEGNSDVTRPLVLKVVHSEKLPLLKLTIRTVSLPTAIQRVPYRVTFAVEGGVPPYSWSLLQGKLPVGLRIGERTGEIIGVPWSTGTYSFDIQVRDSKGQIERKPYKLLVVSGSVSPPGVPEIFVIVALLMSYGAFVGWHARYKNRKINEVLDKYGGVYIEDHKTGQTVIDFPSGMKQKAQMELISALNKTRAIGCFGQLFFIILTILTIWYLF